MSEIKAKTIKMNVKLTDEAEMDVIAYKEVPPRKEPTGLCIRCEHRARYYETGHGPRCECGEGRALDNSRLADKIDKLIKDANYTHMVKNAIYDISKSLRNPERPFAVWSCYMYQPVVPFALESSNPDDPRSILDAPFIAGRAKAAFLPRIKYEEKDDGQVAMTALEIDGKLFKSWMPANLENKSFKIVKKSPKKNTKSQARKLKAVKGKKK